MKSVDKLRTLPRHGTNGFGAVVTVNEETIDAIADEIEVEIEERYQLLPVDADGVPIRVGDKVEYCGLTFDVFSVTEDVVFRECGFESGRYIVDVYDHSDVRHVKPRTLEDVLREFASDYRRAMNAFEEGDEYGPSITELTARCADEIRELLGGDAE